MIGINIQRLRQKWKLSQTDMGALIGCSRNQVANMENGRTLPTIDTLAQLEKLAGMPLTGRELTLSELPMHPFYDGHGITQVVDYEQRLQRIESMLERLLSHFNIESNV